MTSTSRRLLWRHLEHKHRASTEVGKGRVRLHKLLIKLPHAQSQSRVMHLPLLTCFLFLFRQLIYLFIYLFQSCYRVWGENPEAHSPKYSYPGSRRHALQALKNGRHSTATRFAFSPLCLFYFIFSKAFFRVSLMSRPVILTKHGFVFKTILSPFITRKGLAGEKLVPCSK